MIHIIQDFDPVIDGTSINVFHPPFLLVVIIASALFVIMAPLQGMPL